jgi:outer membrane protein assembly factor BamB
MLWRRLNPLPPLSSGSIDRALPIYGVGRVPQPFGSDIALVTYSDATKTFDYRRVRQDGSIAWQSALPAGGYSSGVVGIDGATFCGPTGYNGFAVVDWRTGAVLQRIDMGVRVRSTPLGLGNGYLAAVGNRLSRFGPTGDPQFVEVPRHVFYGEPALHGGLFFTAGVAWRDDRPTGCVTAVDAQKLEVVWETDFPGVRVPASDTSGVTLHDGYLYATGADAAVTKISTVDGSVAWSIRLRNDERLPVVYRSRPTVTSLAVGGRSVLAVLVTSVQGHVYCLDATDGSEIWTKLPDEAAGIWSPVTPFGDELLVHSGVMLMGLDHEGTAKWRLPIGFDAYTRPTVVGDQVVVCGGDPPNDGYLLFIDPQRPDELSGTVTTNYRHGGSRDVLEVSATTTRLDAVSVDLRCFGRAETEKLRPMAAGGFVWRGDISQVKRGAETVCFATGYADGRRRTLPVYIDAGASVLPEQPSALALDPDKMPLVQPDETASGGVIVAALARNLGKDISPEQAEHMAEYFRSRGLNGHFVWRNGAERMFMASCVPLLEEEGITPDASLIGDVLSAWERDAAGSTSTRS